MARGVSHRDRRDVAARDERQLGRRAHLVGPTRHWRLHGGCRMILLPLPTGSNSAENAPTFFFTSCSTDSGHTLLRVLIGTTQSPSLSASRPRWMGAVSATPFVA